MKDNCLHPVTLQGIFEQAVQIYADEPLVYLETDYEQLSYHQVDKIVGSIAARLEAEGITGGDPICCYSASHLEAHLLFWAAAKMGLVFVPIDHNWPAPLLENIIFRLKPKIIFHDFPRRSAVDQVHIRVPSVMFDADAGENAQTVFSQWLDGAEKTTEPESVSPDDAAVILFTSGSTGEPKGVVLSQGALARSSRLVVDTFSWRQDDIFLNLGDMHTMSGLRNSCVAVLQAGCSLVIAGESTRNSFFSIIDCIRNYHCSSIGTAPIFIRQMVQFRDRIDKKALTSLRSLLCTGSDLTQDLQDQFYATFQIPVLNYYGLTETTGLCIAHTLQTFSHANGSIGLPVGCSAQIVDDSGKILTSGQVGELRIQSDNLMSGYFHMPELTQKVIRKGWFYTGDLATQRTDGHIVLMGRKSNIIKNAYTELICPEEIEAVLEKHPQIVEAGVCGFVSSVGDERIAAFIVPGTQPQDAQTFYNSLRDYINQQLGPHKIPSRYVIMEKLPRTTSGKLLREKLKKEL